MTGLLVGESAYRWNGTVNASTSWRSGQTRSGGTYLKLSTYAKILSIVGLGMAPLSNIALPSSFGGVYQNTVQNPRGFSVVLNATGGGDYSVIQAKKAALIDAVKPDKTVFRQPVLIQYDQLDASGLETSETLEIPALYESGLEMSGDGNSWNEKISLNFRMYLPLLRQQGEKGTALGYQTSVANVGHIMSRSAAGVWSNMAQGANANVRTIAAGNDGFIYAGGQFTNFGDANGDYLAKWNGTAWAAVGAGINGNVLAVAIGPDGSIYIGGDFTNLGDANGDYICKWNGTAWVSLDTGMNGNVSSLSFGPDGSLYAGGAFTLAGGVAGTVNIAKWNGTAWLPLSTGMDGAVYALAFGKDGFLYAGGAFSLAGGVANTATIAKWNGTAWSALGTGTNGPDVRCIAVAPDGSVYAGGKFTIAGGVANTLYLAKWNGAVWSPLRTGMNGYVWSLTFSKDNGLMYAGGGFSTAGGVSLPDRLATWNGSTFMPIDIDLPSLPVTYAIAFDNAGNSYFGFDTSGTAISATVTVPNVGSATAYPKVIFTGPGSLAQLKNYTTGKSIFFNLSLLAGEVATLNLDPANLSFISTFRGNILSTILPGSNLDFELLPGTNNISAYYYAGTTAASAIAMTWRDQYHSIDGAVR
jgi:hypothetical protein